MQATLRERVSGSTRTCVFSLGETHFFEVQAALWPPPGGSRCDFWDPVAPPRGARSRPRGASRRSTARLARRRRRGFDPRARQKLRRKKTVEKRAFADPPPMPPTEFGGGKTTLFHKRPGCQKDPLLDPPKKIGEKTKNARTPETSYFNVRIAPRNVETMKRGIRAKRHPNGAPETSK